jgi:hypothetical protein
VTPGDLDADARARLDRFVEQGGVLPADDEGA